MALLAHSMGWLGTILILIAYFLLSRQRISGASKIYQFLNLFGAIFVGFNVFYQKAWPVVVLNIVWASIALVTLIRNK